MPNLFKKFGGPKASPAYTPAVPASGLYVAKEIIKAHKGKIWAESDEKARAPLLYEFAERDKNDLN